MLYKTISIIICSQKDRPIDYYRDVLLLSDLSVEVVVVDNKDNHYSLFSAYNEGVTRSTGDLLCFVHDDVQIHTADWGDRVITYFNADTSLGLIGIAGGHFLPNTVSGWYHSNIWSGGCLQTYNGNTKDTHRLERFANNSIIEVVAVDGVWMCIPKVLFDSQMLRFDDIAFNAFHCYDIDISLQVRELGYKVCIVRDIVLEHFSWGNFNSNWYNTSKILLKKWQDALPLVAGVNMTKKQVLMTTYSIKRTIVNDFYSDPAWMFPHTCALYRTLNFLFKLLRVYSHDTWQGHYSRVKRIYRTLDFNGV